MDRETQTPLQDTQTRKTPWITSAAYALLSPLFILSINAHSSTLPRVISFHLSSSRDVVFSETAEWMGVKWVEPHAVSHGPLVSRSFLIHEHFPLMAQWFHLGQIHSDPPRPRYANMITEQKRERETLTSAQTLHWGPLVSHQSRMRPVSLGHLTPISVPHI